MDYFSANTTTTTPRCIPALRQYLREVFSLYGSASWLMLPADFAFASFIVSSLKSNPILLSLLLLFPTYHRRSGLQDRLTVAELRRLTEKLRKRRPGNDKKKDKDRAGGCVVDYEKLCVLLTGVPDSIPISRSEAVFSRLQDCVEDSVSDGRPFLSLCALVDRQQTGIITKEVISQLCTYTPMNAHRHSYAHKSQNAVSSYTFTLPNRSLLDSSVISFLVYLPI